MDAYFSFSRAHADAEAEHMGHDEALGYALAAEYSSREPIVTREQLIAGMPGSRSLVCLNIGGLSCAENVPSELQDTQWATEAEETISLWRPRTTGARFGAEIMREFNDADRLTLEEPSLGWGGGWGGHAVLGYDRVLRDGVGGIAVYVHENMLHAKANHADDATVDWYRALLHVCTGITAVINNHAQRARELAAATIDEDAQEHFLQIAKTCAHVAVNGARNLREAVQLFWFIHILDDTDSPGRIDQFLFPYYTDPSSADPILEALWQRLVDCRSWNVCLGGQKSNGSDATNPLTYHILDIQERVNREAPNLSVRLHKGSPPKLMLRCVELISKGTGLPALYNDEALIPALTDIGIPVEHARNYALNGCMQVDIQGLSHMGLEDGEVNLAKCLELALHEGKSPITGRQAGAHTLPLSSINDMTTLQRQLAVQVEHCVDIMTRCSNIFQRVTAETAPHLFRSLFIDPCIERGKDIKRGGPLYNHGQFLTEGLANTGDSLFAINKLVFEEKRFSLTEIVDILDANWEGHESLRTQILTRIPKYGNDCEEPDELTVKTLEHYFRYLRTRSTWRGGMYAGGLSTFNRAPYNGEHLAASADGRVKGETVADSCGPMRGRDQNGPTAMLMSAAKLPHHLAVSGFCLNLKLSPSVFANESDGSSPYQKIADLFTAYFRMGGQQLQVNVVDAETLRAAQATPDAYKSLIVRVGGFSARFVNLDKALQNDIIARTEHGV